MKNLFVVALFCVTYFISEAQIIVDSPEYQLRKQNNTLQDIQIENNLNIGLVDPNTPLKLDKNPSTQDKTTNCDCYIQPDASYTLAMQPNDDGSSAIINIPFDFCFYGQNYNQLYINNNGNVTFESSLFTFTPDAFPSPDNKIIAPFWGDVDTRGVGQVLYKITPTAIYVNWEEVGYYNTYTDKVNTFQLILTDGNDPAVSTGNIAFCYKDMQWTTGDASDGVNGFAGAPATAGANKGDNTNFFMIAQFDHPGSDFDGALGNPDGISWLDNKSFYFNICNANNIPPIPDGVSSCDTFALCSLSDTANIQIKFLSPEVDQNTTISYTTSSSQVVTEIDNISGNTATLLLRAIAIPGSAGYHTVTVTATDNFVPAGVTSVTFTIFIDSLSGINMNPIITPLSGCDYAELSVLNGPYDTYLWDDLTTGQTDTLTSTSVYGVTVSKNGCYKRVEELIKIEQSNFILLGDDTYCSAEISTNYFIQDSARFSSISWSLPTQERDTMFNNNLIGGTYTVSLVTLEGLCQIDTTFTITEMPSPIVDPVTSQEVCDGEDFLDITFTGSANTDFNWTNSDPNIGLPASGTGDILAFTATGTTPLGGPLIVTIEVTPFIQGGCEGVPITFTLKVNATEDASFDIEDSYCTTEGIQIPVMTTTTPGGFFESFSGVVVDPTTGQFDVSTLTEGQYEITYNTPGNSGFCGTNSSEYFYVVDPANLNVNPIGSQSVCDNTLFSDIIFSGASAGAQYNWTNDNTAIGLAASGTGNIDEFYAQGTVDGSSTSITATITVTPVALACAVVGNTETFTLEVNPKPIIDAIADFAICEGSSAVISVVNASGIYDWDNGVSGASQTVSPITTTEYKVTKSVLGCSNIDSVTVSVNPNPIVEAGTYSDVCIDAPMINLAGSPSGGVFTGSGVNGIVFNPTFGTQTISYSITDVNGCTGTDQTTIIVNNLPIVSIDPINDICIGQSVTLNAQGALSYSWDNGLGSGSSQTITPTNSINYSVIGVDANGCKNIASIPVNVNQLPIIVAGNDLSICLGEDTTITATGGQTYVWDNGLGLGASHLVNPAQTTTYNVVGTDANGCTNTDQIVVNIIGPPVIAAGNDTTICEGNQITLSGTGTTSYTWNNGVTDGLAFTPPVGITTYGLTGTSADGCTAFDDLVVTVLEQPEPIIVPSITEGTPVLTVTFDNFSQNATSYTWYFANGTAGYTIDNLSSQTAEFGTIQTYAVSFTASNGVCSNDTTILINVINFEPIELVVPNIFTPSGDSQNDWYYLDVKNAKSLEAQIFNRWGNLVYEINGLFDANIPGTYWDGKINDKEATEGVYFIKYTILGMDNITTKGQENIQLIRK